MSKTLFMLMAAHDGRPLLPVDLVCREYFAPMTLQRYTHIKATGDKFAGWRWLDIAAPPKEEEDEPDRP